MLLNVLFNILWFLRKPLCLAYSFGTIKPSGYHIHLRWITLHQSYEKRTWIEVDQITTAEVVERLLPWYIRFEGELEGNKEWLYAITPGGLWEAFCMFHQVDLVAKDPEEEDLMQAMSLNEMGIAPLWAIDLLKKHGEWGDKDQEAASETAWENNWAGLNEAEFTDMAAVGLRDSMLLQERIHDLASYMRWPSISLQEEALLERWHGS